MKKIKYTLFMLGAVLLGTTACNDLDLEPSDYYKYDAFWKNTSQAQGFIYGIHNRIRGNYQNYWLLGEARGGFQQAPNTSLMTSVNNIDIKTQQLTSDQTGVSDWAGFYNSEILDVNLAIKQLEQADYLSTDDKNYFLGQVYGIRAWYYFWLYRTYGGVPINDQVKVLEKAPTTAKDLYVARSTPREVMDFIKKDLKKSEEYFGNKVKVDKDGKIIQKAQWSKFATLMLKAEVYLWSAKVTTGDQSPDPNDIDKAEAALLAVKNSAKFGLENEFAKIFDTNNKENTEIIFTLPFVENEQTNWANSFLYNRNLFTGKFAADGTKFNSDPLRIRTAAGVFRHEYTYNLFKKYDADDTRRSATFLDFYTDANKANPGLLFTKYIGSINTSGQRVYNSDIPIYRYADVLLMLAEVANKKGQDPSQYINQIRQRAYGNATHAYTNSTFEDNELAILAERDKEFVGENKRWFDILRMQDASGKPLVFSPKANYGSSTPILDPATEAYKVLWPVNVGVYNNNPLITQTPGYGDF